MNPLTPCDLDAQAATVQQWADQLDNLIHRFSSRFARSEARQRLKAYLQGLLSPVERKNGWQLAEQAGYATPYAFQHLLDRAVWDADLVRDDLRSYVLEHLADPDAVLVVDETGFLKKGDKSCGVARQYSGTAGRIENAQVGVFLGYASSKGHTFLDRQLYLPEDWTKHPERCQGAEVPEEVLFATKPKIAKAMLERAFEAKVPCRWVTGDAVYGNDRSLRFFLEEQGKSYVMAVSGQESVWIGFAQYQVKTLLKQVPEDAWHRLSAGEGAKGPRLYDWAYVRVNSVSPYGWERGMLVRRSLSDPNEKTAYITYAPSETTLQTLVLVAGTRWSIECCLQEAKGEVGLDQYEVRSWHGWYRHITLSMAAHAYLVVTRLQGEDGPFKGGLANPGNSLRHFKSQRGLVCR
jgi:SRSO17 transposase